MTARQAGVRIGEMSAARRGGGRPAARRAGERQELSPREKRRLAQLAVCAVAFAFLVAVKLLLPARMGQVRNSISALMEQNMDVTEVFSAVGRAVSGEESVRETMGDVYQAVFFPDGKAVETSAPAGSAQTPAAAMRTPDAASSAGEGVTEKTAAASPASSSSAARESAANSEKTAAAASGAQDAAAQKLSKVLYSENNLPQNVSLEQAVLGFDYCTPVSGTLSSDFGYREHPIEGEERFHYGVDLAADTGAEIDSFADGAVTAVGESSSYGKYLIVAHRGGYSTLYAHCSKVVVSSGDKVKKGQKIAEVGETGLATGPHLHFELHEGNLYLDPIYYVTAA